MSLPAAWLARPAWAEARGACDGGEVGAASGALPPPGVDAVIEALAAHEPDPDQVTQALTVFAWERASTSADLACAIAEVAELWDLLESSGHAPISRAHAQHCLADAWVDAVAAERGSPGVDPLSGLHTPGYLYGRVHELDQQSSDPPAALVLIVVRWECADGPWMRLARILQVASALRSLVRPDATLSQIDATMAVALVPDDARARLDRIALTKAVKTGELSTANVQVDVFAVPDARSRLPELVTRLRREANVDLATRLPQYPLLRDGIPGLSSRSGSRREHRGDDSSRRGG